VIDEEPLDSRGRNITLAVFGLIVLVIAVLVINNYRTKAGWVRALKGDDVAARTTAAQAMMRKGQVAEQLQGDRPTVRSAAVRALAHVATTPAVEQLIQFYKDPDGPIKEQAKQAVIAIGFDTAHVPVVKALGDSDDSVRVKSDETLRAWGEQSVPVAAPKLVDNDARNAAANALIEIGKQKPERAYLVQQAVYPYLDPKTQGVDEVVQVKTVQILDGVPDPRSVPHLITMLEYPQTQRAAVGALGRKADKRATQGLLKVLRENELIRSETVIALGRIADQAAVPDLVKFLGSFSEQLRTETAEALRAVGPPAVPALLVAVKSPDAYTRSSAVTALGGIRDPRAQSAALAAMKDPDANVRVAAATSLRTAPSTSAISPMIAAFSDHDGRVSDAAAETVSVIADVAPGGESAIPRLIAALDTGANPGRGYYAGKALRLIDRADRVVPALIGAMRGANPEVASNAALLLGDLAGGPETQRALAALRGVASGGASPQVRWAAERSAQRLGGSETS
jgi:HEAT repeat protein